MPFVTGNWICRASTFRVGWRMGMRQSTRPQLGQCAGLPSDRVALRKRELLHPLGHLRSRRVPANVPILPGRIRPHHEEIRACFEAAMTCPGRQYGYVPSLDRNLAAIRAAENQTRGTGGKRQHFMRSGMVMMKGINAVAPLGRPTVALE